ncbi:MAG: PAS domain S-box protein, partial [Verrucomicrobiaceae bacterium]
AADGRVVWLRDIVTVTVEDDGVTRLRGIMVDVTAQKEMEKRLHQKEEHFRRLIENAWDCIVVVAEDGTIQYTSPAISRLLGYQPEEVVGTRADTWIAPEDVERCLNLLQKVFTKGMAGIPIEFRSRHKDGSVRIFEATGKPYMDEQGNPVAVINARDITERRKAMEARRASDERYRSLVLASAQVIWVTDPNGNPIQGQPSWCALTGQNEEELKGQGWLSAVHPDDREGAQRIWKEAVEKKSYYSVEFRIRATGKGYRDFAVRGAPVLDLDGSIREWVGTCADITEQKRAAAYIRKWKNRYEAAVESSGQLLAEWTPATNEVAYRGNLEGILGYTIPEMSGGAEKWLALVHPDDREEMQRRLSYALQTYGTFLFEYRIRHKDGTFRFVTGSGQAYHDTEENVDRLLGLVSDITEQRNTLLQLAKAKETAEEASCAKDEFLAALSHELRTPLNPVLMLTSELENSAEISPSIRADFAMIRKNVELEARMIDDLLDITRITRGKLHLNLRTLEAHTVLRQAV